LIFGKRSSLHLIEKSFTFGTRMTRSIHIKFIRPFIAVAAAVLAVFPPILIAAQARQPLELLVVGDSLIFGQGLLEKDKIYTHVAEWLRTSAPGLPREVHLKTKAHSGSTLKFHANEVEAFRKAGRDETFSYKPEVNVSFPSTWKQLEVAAAEYRASGKSGADLILLSTCITDISVAKVLDPKGDDELLRRETKQFCHDDMLELLNHAARLHPQSTIAVIGYFPMISPKSKGKRLFNGWLEARDTSRPMKWLMNNPITRKLFFQKIGNRAIERSRLWFEESNKQLASAIGDFNRQAGRTRAVFVRSPLTEDNSVEAPNTMLFRMGKNGVPEDPMFQERKAHCNQALAELKRSTGLDYPIRFCEVAGVGHPNPTGARKYAEAIQTALGPNLLMSL
jgi:hypothetical protein